jgi:hypothetical protein
MGTTFGLGAATGSHESKATVNTVPTSSSQESTIVSGRKTLLDPITDILVKEETIFASDKGINGEGDNYCAGTEVDLPNVECITQAVANPSHGPQSGANVTRGYQGTYNATTQPIMVPFYQVGLCR